jgi:hypothetical protein
VVGVAHVGHLHQHARHVGTQLLEQRQRSLCALLAAVAALAHLEPPLLLHGDRRTRCATAPARHACAKRSRAAQQQQL